MRVDEAFPENVMKKARRPLQRSDKVPEAKNGVSKTVIIAKLPCNDFSLGNVLSVDGKTLQISW